MTNIEKPHDDSSGFPDYEGRSSSLILDQIRQVMKKDMGKIYPPVELEDRLDDDLQLQPEDWAELPYALSKITGLDISDGMCQKCITIQDLVLMIRQQQVNPI